MGEFLRNSLAYTEKGNEHPALWMLVFLLNERNVPEWCAELRWPVGFRLLDKLKFDDRVVLAACHLIRHGLRRATFPSRGRLCCCHTLASP